MNYYEARRNAAQFIVKLAEEKKPTKDIQLRVTLNYGLSDRFTNNILKKLGYEIE